VNKYEDKVESRSRLPYSAGDRVITTLMNEQGLVKELTPLHTTIRLDSGKELILLNNSILSGTVAVAKITKKEDEQKSSEK
jgi:hypothetical protein